MTIWQVLALLDHLRSAIDIQKTGASFQDIQTLMEQDWPCQRAGLERNWRTMGI